MADSKAVSTREKLILAGMDEIRMYGVQGFSLRRVATACGISCAAPYKHFEDKQELFTEMIRYVNEKWRIILLEGDDKATAVCARIADAAVRYLRFLTDNPHFRAILMIKEMGLDNADPVAQAGLSVAVKRILVQYGKIEGLSRAELRERIFLVRSLTYGAAIIIGADNAIDKESYFDTLRAAVMRALRR